MIAYVFKTYGIPVDSKKWKQFDTINMLIVTHHNEYDSKLKLALLKRCGHLTLNFLVTGCYIVNGFAISGFSQMKKSNDP